MATEKLRAELEILTAKAEKDLKRFDRSLAGVERRITSMGGKGGKSLRPLGEGLSAATVNANEFEKSMAAANARVIAFGASAGLIFQVQKALKDAGYYKDSVNGRFNQNTESAILKYQKHQGLPLNPIASQDLVKHILANKQIQSLLKQLETKRLRAVEKARKALLTEAKIRKIVFGAIDNFSQTKNDSNQGRTISSQDTHEAKGGQS
mgnify:CR=1 FL=1